MTADEALASEAGASGTRNLREKADNFLSDALAGGPMLRDDLFRSAAESGIGQKPLYNAAQRLGIVKKKSGFSKGARWHWSMPNTGSPAEEDLLAPSDGQPAGPLRGEAPGREPNDEAEVIA